MRPFIARQATAALRHKLRTRALPGALRHRRSVAAPRRRRRRELRGRGAIHRELMCSPTSRNLVRVFLLQDRLKGLGGKPHGANFVTCTWSAPASWAATSRRWSAFRGMTVTLQDRTAELIQPAMDRAKAFFDKRLKDPQAAAEALARLRMDVDGDGAAHADVVIEAIFENVDAKRALYAELEPRLKPDAVLATNTSSIKIEVLGREAPGSEAPGRASISSIPSRKCSWWRSSRARHAGARRVQAALLVHPQARQAAAAVQERARVRREPHPDALHQRSAVRPRRGHPRRGDRPRPGRVSACPWGPIELADVVGLDVSLHVGRVLAEAFSGACPRYWSNWWSRRSSAARAAKASTSGGTASRVRPPTGTPSGSAARSGGPVDPAHAERGRCVLREGVVEDADLLDAGAIFATGFAPFRGGPLQYAQSARHRRRSTVRLAELEQRYGERFRPDPGWSRLVPRDSCSSVTPYVDADATRI